MTETSEERSSSFDLDANIGAYALVRESLVRGESPDPTSVRTEDFVNAFEYGDPAPGEHTFALRVEGMPSPYREGYHLLRVSVRSKDLEVPDERPATRLVILVDVSTAMEASGWLELVRDGLRTLAERLRAADEIAIVTYGHRAQIALPVTSGDRKAAILTAIDGLRVAGETNLDAGLATASDLALSASPTVTRRIVICTNGIANPSRVRTAELLDRVRNVAERGIHVSTLGIGLGQHPDTLIEQFSVRGDGFHAFVDRRPEVRRAFAENLVGSRQIVARSANVRVEFDDRVVARFRQLGYEPLDPERRGFDSRATTAGAIAAEHAVTALYEIQLHADIALGDARDMGTVQVVYRGDDGLLRAAREGWRTDAMVEDRTLASPSIRLAAVAAVFAEKLRQSYWASGLDWSDVTALFAELPEATRQPRDVTILGDMIARAAALSEGAQTIGAARTTLDRLTVLK